MINLTIEELQVLIQTALTDGANTMQANPPQDNSYHQFYTSFEVEAKKRAEEFKGGRNRHVIDLERVASVI